MTKNRMLNEYKAIIEKKAIIPGIYMVSNVRVMLIIIMLRAVTTIYNKKNLEP